MTSRYVSVTVHVDDYVSVDFDLAEIDTKELRAELLRRNEALPPDSDVAKLVLERAYEAYRASNLLMFDNHLRDLFDIVLGRVAGRSPLLTVETNHG